MYYMYTLIYYQYNVLYIPFIINGLIINIQILNATVL